MDTPDDDADENSDRLNGVLLNGDKTLDLDKMDWCPVTHSRVPRSKVIHRAMLMVGGYLRR